MWTASAGLALALIAGAVGQNVKDLQLNGPSSSVYTNACGTYSYFSVLMTDPCLDLVVSVTKSAGEPNIYISKSVKYPNKASMSWAAFAYGSYSATVSHWSPDSSPGLYYVSVYADCTAQASAAVYSIQAASVQNNDGTDIYLNSALSASVTVAPGQYKSFRFCLPAHTATANSNKAADPGVVLIGGTNGLLSNKLIVTSVVSGTLAAGVSLSGVGITSPCSILSCTSYASPAAADTGSVICTLSSRQNIPGPSYITIAAASTTSLAVTSLAVTLRTFSPSAASFGTIAPTATSIVAGMTVADFTGAITPRTVQSYASTTATSGTATVKGGTTGPGDLAGTTYTVGLRIGGANFASGAAGPNMGIPLLMRDIRGQSAAWTGDQCADVVFSWTMVDAPGTPHSPDVIVSRTATAPQVNSYAFYRSDYSPYGTFTIPAEKVVARDNHGFLSGSWYVSLYGYCAFSEVGNRGASKAYANDDDLASGKCRTGDVPTTITLSVSIVPRPTSACADNLLTPNSQTPAFALTPALSGDLAKPAYTVLTSGRPRMPSDNVDTAEGYNYYKIENKNGCNSMNVVLRATSAVSAAVTASTAVGSKDVTVPTTTPPPFAVGSEVTGDGIPVSTTITAVSVTSSTTKITLSLAATEDSTTAQLTFTTLMGDAVSKYISPEIVIGKWPNVAPKYPDDKAWTGYSSFSQNFTIDAWDPALDGGNTCGRKQQDSCWYYIGVFGYDGSNGSFASINYQLTVTLTNQHAIFGVPQLAQLVAPGGQKQYKFCINTDPVSPFYSKDARVNLYSYTDSCACPESYADLQVVVSKGDPSAGIHDNVWRIGHGYKDASGVSVLDLAPSTDSDVRAGTYYLSVLGYCTASAFCRNACKCAPCSNLPSSPYTVSVHAIAAAESNPQPSCVALETYAAYGQAQCCYKLADTVKDIVVLKDVSKRTMMIANGAVGLSVILWLLLLAALAYFVVDYIRGRLFPHQALASKEVELGVRGVDHDTWAAAPPLGLSAHGSGHGSGHGSAHGSGQRVSSSHLVSV